MMQAKNKFFRQMRSSVIHSTKSTIASVFLTLSPFPKRRAFFSCSVMIHNHQFDAILTVKAARRQVVCGLWWSKKRVSGLLNLSHHFRHRLHYRVREQVSNRLTRTRVVLAVASHDRPRVRFFIFIFFF